MLLGKDTCPAGTITSLLLQARQGSKPAQNQLFDYTYDQLRQIAREQLVTARQQSNLSATALVNAACMRLLGNNNLDAENRRHFYFLLGRAMHDVLVEEVRAACTLKRGGGHRRIPLLEVEADGATLSFDIMDLHDALNELRSRDEPSAQVIMLRFFGHRTLEEAAELMGCTFAVARRHWDYGKAWLYERLSRGQERAE